MAAGVLRGELVPEAVERKRSTSQTPSINYNNLFCWSELTSSLHLARLKRIYDKQLQFSLLLLYITTILIMPGLTSASGVLGFLFDEEPELKVFALQTLNDDIDTLWAEVAGSVGQMYVEFWLLGMRRRHRRSEAVR